MSATIENAVNNANPASGSATEGERLRAAASLARRSGRVLLIAPQPFYQDRGTPIATQLVLAALTELGYEVDLLTYPLGASPKIEGVNYQRLPNLLGFDSIPVSFSWKKLFLDGLLALRLPFMARRGRYIYVHAIEEAAFLAVLLRPLHRSPVVYDMASSLPEQLALKRIFRATPVQKTFRAMERKLLNSVDCVIASAGLGGFVSTAAAATPVFEWRFPADSAPVTASEVCQWREEFGLAPGVPVVCYTGTFAAYQGIPQLLEAIPKVVASHPDACFLLVGAQDETEVSATLEAVPASLRGNIRVLPRQSREAVRRFMAVADVLVSPRMVGDNIPLKVFDFLAMEKPVVATRIAAHEAILSNNLAMMVEPSSEGIAEGVSSVLSDPSLANRLASSARAYAEQHLSWPGFVQLIDDIGQTASQRRLARRARAVTGAGPGRAR